jgi:predicted CopG family antitoxin
MHIRMTSKNISVTEDVYELLSRMKLKGESFSDAIRRLAGRRRLADCAGLWADVSEKEMKAFWESVGGLRKSALESLRENVVEGR